MATTATGKHNESKERPSSTVPPIRLTGQRIDGRLHQELGFRPTDAPATRFGANVARWRRRRGLTQAALARALGRDDSTICRWESGLRTPSLPALLALARALGCDPAALLDGAAAPTAGTDQEER